MRKIAGTFSLKSIYFLIKMFWLLKWKVLTIFRESSMLFLIRRCIFRMGTRRDLIVPPSIGFSPCRITLYRVGIIEDQIVGVLLLFIFEVFLNAYRQTILRDFSDAQRSGTLVSRIHQLAVKDIRIVFKRYWSVFPKIYEL